MFTYVGNVLARYEPRFREHLKHFRKYRGEVEQLPFYLNDFFTSLDALVLYGIIRRGVPGRYIEVGSGFSTQFARVAASASPRWFEIICVDPKPRCDIERVATVHIKKPVQEADPNIFVGPGGLDGGDILFVDGSHVVEKGGDVVYILLEVLPRLRPGVLIHFHDVFLPFDYPSKWDARKYSEQYMLAMLLLYSDKFHILMSNAWMSPWEGLAGKSLWLVRK